MLMRRLLPCILLKTNMIVAVLLLKTNMTMNMTGFKVVHEKGETQKKIGQAVNMKEQDETPTKEQEGPGPLMTNGHAHIRIG